MNPVPNESLLWTEPLKFRSYDVDSTRQASIVSLCRYFLEAAWNHAEALGVGFGYLARQGKFWVLSRLAIEVQRLPDWGSAATLRTWPRGARSVFALREFEIVDEAGARLVAGSSAWLVLDAASKRPQRLQPILPGLMEVPSPTALGRDPEKLPPGDVGAAVFSLVARHSDTDVNCHVGSSRYLAWLLDAYPTDFHRQHRLRTLEVNYLGETRVGDSLSVHVRQTGPATYSHSLTRAEGEEVCRARLTWERAAAA